MKLSKLKGIIDGLNNIHAKGIIHRNLHSGNIFFNKNKPSSSDVVIGDLGISKSATESTDNNENYGIIPYMAPEIFQGHKYTMASDVYSFGMIMWEFMTCRRPFWDRNHDIELIIEICEGLRPPIVTNAPEGYIELMKECWHFGPNKRPTAADIYDKINRIWDNEWKIYKKNPTKIIPSSDIGPVTINNPGAIYKSRPLNGMIQSAMYLWNSKSQSINLNIDPFYYYQKKSTIDKRRFENDLIENNNDKDQIIKRRRLFENENNGYLTKEIEIELDNNMRSYYQGN
ncbi:kinase-like domain-containing protein [Glomus cerebriforme]|uniref:Kinase-like domain-containing protein n=1 Tax=Glomus cerebriforme TaxID=658196 RepID=A0A397TLD7_9GLOM|nr:kinase-like domain-containing protein [Glomus cerebriforme]